MFDFEKKKGTLIPIEEWKIIPPAIPLRVCVCVCVSMLADKSYIGDSLFAFFPHSGLFISIFLHSCRIS